MARFNSFSISDSPLIFFAQTWSAPQLSNSHPNLRWNTGHIQLSGRVFCTDL